MPFLLRWFALTAALMMTVADVQAAKIDPPTIALGRPTTSIVIATFKEHGPDQRIVFAKIRQLAGPVDAPELIDLATPDLPAPLRIGERYVLAYSNHTNDRLKRTMTNARGGAFVATPGLEPAIWEDRGEIEDLLMWRIGDDLVKVREALPRLLGLLQSRDPQLQGFAAAEIAFRPALIAVLEPSSQRRIRAFVERARAPADARARLLLAAIDMPADPPSVRAWDAAAKHVLATSPIVLRDLRRHSEFVAAAFRYCEHRNIMVAPAALRRWLRSDDAALAEMALLGLRRQSARAELDALDAVISRDDVPADTHRFLVDHRRRLASVPLTK